MSDHNHNHDHGHDHGHGGYTTHYSFKDYLIGFVLSVILTAIPFWLVMGGAVSADATKTVIVIFAGIQVVVQMIYFLHMNAKSEAGWNLMALILTVVLLVIVLAGSIWVMYHMNTNMMPSHTSGFGGIGASHEMN